MGTKKTVVVGLSGGVDSAVAAYLLKEEGYNVIAMFMQNWHNTEGTLYGDCPWKDDHDIAKLVAKKLDIPFHFIDLSVEYKKRVVDYMFSEYEKGRTPNPDVLCNREIKFDAFLKACEALGADFVATGHYCQKETINIEGKEVHRLIAGTDGNKDQSYFLCQLSQEQLAKSLFPIGHLVKSEVRQIAKQQNLPNADRKDSQGICFVGKVDLPLFLQQKLEAKKGDVIEIKSEFYEKNYNKSISDTDYIALSRGYKYKPSDGVKLGVHNGAHFFTIGQRKGINIGGKIEPLFVIGTNIDSNTLFVGEGNAHKGLYRKALKINLNEVHWVRPDLALKENTEQEFDIRIRYRQPLQKGKLVLTENGLFIIFNTEQRGITSGQFAAWYLNNELIGSGVIS